MNRCSKCNVQVNDETMMCPLCRSVINTDIPIEKSVSKIYPDAEIAIKKLRFIIKLMIFISIVTESILVLINYLTYNGVKWSLLCGAGFIYANLSVIYTFKHNVGHRTKLFIEGIGIAALTVVIDLIIGYKGWSLSYAVPITLMVVDMAIVLLMLINSTNWQTYLFYHIYVMVISLVLFILGIVNVIKHPLLNIILFGVSAIIFIGIMMFGGKRGSNEITRKFRM